MRKFLSAFLLWFFVPYFSHAESSLSFTSVPTETLQDWHSTIQELQQSLRLKSLRLEASEKNVTGLMDDINSLNLSIKKWQKDYENLNGILKQLNADSGRWRAESVRLEEDLKRIVSSYQSLEKKLNHISAAARNRLLGMGILGGLLVIETAVLLGVIFYGRNL